MREKVVSHSFWCAIEYNFFFG